MPNGQICNAVHSAFESVGSDIAYFLLEDFLVQEASHLSTKVFFHNYIILVIYLMISA